MSSQTVNLSPSELAQDRRGQVIGASVTLLIIPTVVVALRLLSRWVSRAGFWWDDFTIIVACFLCWGPNIASIVALNYGSGQHVKAYLDASGHKSLLGWFKFIYAFEFLYTLAMSSVKYSIILFQYRIFPIVQFRRILLWCKHFVVCFTITYVLVIVFQCVPIHDFWYTQGGNIKSPNGGRCINVENYNLIAGSINAVTDFALLALPIPILWHLKTSQRQKLVLTGIFSMGLAVCAVSIIRLVVLHQNKERRDVTWYYVPVAIWTSAEPAMAVVSACLPSLRPLFVRVFWGRAHRPRSTVYPSSDSRLATNTLRHVDDSTYNRLQEVSTGPWSKHNVKVYGGRRRGDAESDEVELGGAAPLDTPTNRIRMKTEVVLTISDRVDFQDDLF